MMKLTTIFLAICLLPNAFCLDYDGWLNIKLEHSLNCNYEKYCSRGSITLKSIRAGTAVIDQISFNKDHIEELKQLAELDEFYTLRTLVSTAESKDVEIVTFIKAKSFLENGLSDIIRAWVLPNGEVIALSLQAGNTSQTKPIEYKSTDNKLNSSFYIRHVDQAPLPDTASYIQKMEREREAREKGELKDNRSFLAKYWMYIVPIAIFVMISGAANPEPAGQAR
ncbi:ER membrane protein complex subunit 10 [Melitaea cinxia]|uniref:ER membrane protein complex subunit 10 n=1 Tax=Melitaea cinxia TaxID=113334 RepID=UPI001E270B55|nr:ER membrane protein complex subunit 10 [Melitaea cinxia]XP_045459671.1 ER membrane protein complex subunit 10 [Melitaea cinxia]